VIFYYPANGNRSLARIIEVLLYLMNTDHETVRYAITSDLLLARPSSGAGTALQNSDTHVT
jgi:hypothetical protein